MRGSTQLFLVGVILVAIAAASLYGWAVGFGSKSAYSMTYEDIVRTIAVIFGIVSVGGVGAVMWIVALVLRLGGR